MTEIKALALDFDGVVVESVELKNRAFGELFRKTHPDKVDAVVAFHVANMGVSRFEKFPRIYAEVLGEPFPEGASERLDAALTALVYDGVVACPFVPGARELIERRGRVLPVFVASATPEEEVRSLVEARGLAAYIKATYGSPARKADSLKRVVAEAGCAAAEVLFVGDTSSDQRAAREAGVTFVGRVPRGAEPRFEPEDGLRTVADLAELDRVWDDIH